MDSNNLNKKIGVAAKWSVATEIAAKLISPISNMILARFLTPEAFGVVATVTMITSFADMFTDAGFQKYLVQHDFKDKKDQFDSTTVAFWTNLFISLFLWFIIICNRDWLAKIVGNPNLGIVIAVACFSLPLTSFSSIQMALFRREFAFKTLFVVRLIAICVPIVVTVPLAIVTRSYWSLIIGTISVNLVNAIVLTIKSEWKPRLFYSFDKFKEMFSFSFWTLVEQIAIWLTSYIDTFIVGTLLTTYYVGIYKTSTTTVNQIMALITSATTPVLFAALSRVQDNDVEFKKIFFKFQRLVGMFVIPLGAGIYLYRNLVTDIMLGKQWSEAAGFVGLWGLMSSITIIFSHFSSEAYRAKGQPRISLFIQISHLVILAPAVYIACQSGYEVLYKVRALIRLELVAANMIMMCLMFSITPIMQIKNIIPEVISTFVMIGCSLMLKQISDGYIWQFISIIICAMVYFGILVLIPCHRNEILGIIMPYIKKIKQKLLKKTEM